MPKLDPSSPPSDQAQRTAALDTSQSFLVEAPAGSGKTDLLTRRFLRLLTTVDDPSQIVAITFTRPAAAEMRHRILSELEKAAFTEPPGTSSDSEPTSMGDLARQAWLHAQSLDWRIRDLPNRLRIQTIDSFCRDIAVQQPVLSGFASSLDIHDNPTDLYRTAARRTLERIDSVHPQIRTTIETLLLWRDNNWGEMEDLLVRMLARRDAWMHSFVLKTDQDVEALRKQLERPFVRSIRAHLRLLAGLFHRVPTAEQELLSLARFACNETKGAQHAALAQIQSLPVELPEDHASIAKALEAWKAVASLLLIKNGSFRKSRSFDIGLGFPPDCRAEKERIATLVASLASVNGLEAALASVTELPPPAYTEDDWTIMRACFTLLTYAAAELRVAFAEAGATDFTEVAQIAQHILRDEDNRPSDAAITIADGIRHILVDEFQDTSRDQHQLLGSLVAAWPDTENRSLFVVGDPKQSIYFFRNADAELFPRVAQLGLDTAHNSSFPLHPLALSSNFRTVSPLVDALNEVFSGVFAKPDGSGIQFSHATPARNVESVSNPHLQLHLAFTLKAPRRSVSLTESTQSGNNTSSEIEAAQETQLEEIAQIIRTHADRVERARSIGEKYRIAVLGRTRVILEQVASHLRQSGIPFFAVELESLQSQPEILDALSLGRALLNPYDRVAWLGVLRAPWCALSLDDLFAIAGADNLPGPLPDIPSLLRDRLGLLSAHGRSAAQRVLRLLDAAPRLQARLPNATLGTWLKQAWLLVEGPRCVNSRAWANLDLLWRSLDRVQGGAQGFLDSALDDVLKRLAAQPDPETSADCGVQLMTIHKSKGLEFEVVIVPELQRDGRRKDGDLLSWLERGLVERDASQAISEFLVAPIPTKGSEGGLTKKWVDREYQAREDQEMRRILYVAATRAREALHLFARIPVTEKDDALHLAPPKRSLLATAMPGLERAIDAQFEDWKATRAARIPSPQTAVIEALAASDSGTLVRMPRPASPAVLRRLLKSDEALSPQVILPISLRAEREGIKPEAFARHQGGWHSRALGDAVHALLEALAQLFITSSWDAALSQLSTSTPRIVAQLRAAGADLAQASRIANEALKITLEATLQDSCKWILSPHPQAQHEVSWTGFADGALRSVRPDRLFLAGNEPDSLGQSTLWIIDYKTSYGAGSTGAETLSALRKDFAPQLELYGRILRHSYSEVAIHAGLYYPRLRSFDWWKLR